MSLKGGCNLRFFFQSVRHSEDIDFDVATIAKATLSKKVDDLLASPVGGTPQDPGSGLGGPFETQTNGNDAALEGRSPGRGFGDGDPHEDRVLPSRKDQGRSLRGYPASVTSTYAMPPFLATHYPVREAIVQKIHALGDRREPQPRDIFDLNHLFPRMPDRIALSREEKSWLPAAIDNAMSISFDDYSSKVVAYLEPEHAELFSARDAWHLMQQVVVDRLTELGT